MLLAIGTQCRGAALIRRLNFDRSRLGEILPIGNSIPEVLSLEAVVGLLPGPFLAVTLGPDKMGKLGFLIDFRPQLLDAAGIELLVRRLLEFEPR